MIKQLLSSCGATSSNHNNTLFSMSKAMLVEVKNSLNAAKSQLDPIYANEREEWERFQATVDLYKPLRVIITRNSNARHVTNAWLKFWEIFSEFNIVDRIIAARNTACDYSRLLVFFNAEFPGAAIAAFNHFMKSRYKNVPFDWRASSLVERRHDDLISNTALGDYYSLWACNKDKWLMNDHNNGDATDINNINDWTARLNELGKVDLYSHDAGVDVSANASSDGKHKYNDQENANARLHLGCALSGFKVLRRGGCFIAKQYTLFEPLTQELITIYASMFDEFYLCKPATSRPANSEIYLVGLGFKGMPAEIETELTRKLQNFSTDSIIPGLQPPMELINFAYEVFTNQREILKLHVRQYRHYCYNLCALGKRLRAKKYAVNSEWLERYPVGAISNEDQLHSCLTNSTKYN